MTLRLYDTATREQRDFVPVRPGQASIYVCGATVQGPPHIGHVRSGLNYDVLRRWRQVTDGYDDQGPIDPALILRRGGLGTGLGAVARLADRVEYREVEGGKVITARFFATRAGRRAARDQE